MACQGPRCVDVSQYFDAETTALVQDCLKLPDQSPLSAAERLLRDRYRQCAHEMDLLSAPSSDVFRYLGLAESAATEPLWFMGAWIDQQRSSGGGGGGGDQSALSLAERFLRDEWCTYTLNSYPMIGESAEHRLGRCIEARTDGTPLVGWHVSLEEWLHLSSHAAVDPFFLPPVPPGKLRLYHGTTRAAATALLHGGVDPERFSFRCDFGSAFYTTLSHQAALAHAIERAISVRGPYQNHAAVICLDVDPRDLNTLGCLSLGPTDDRWADVVAFCRLNKCTDDSVIQDLKAARCVIGPITANAFQVDAGGHTPLPSSTIQYAFCTVWSDALEFLDQHLVGTSAMYYRCVVTL